jgi:hypothetical protein
MSNKRNFFRDRFTFSLRGMNATASFFITPVLADDRINRAWDEKLSAEGPAPAEDGSAPDAPLGRSWSRTTG